MKICKNKKCKIDLPDEANFCFACGKSQEPIKRKHKRINGTGTISKRNDNKLFPYVVKGPAQLILTGKNKGNYKRIVIGHFATVEEAQIALVDFNKKPCDKFNITLNELHEEWKPSHYKHLSIDLQNNYNSAWYKLRTLYNIKIKDLRTAPMQQVIDYYSEPHHKEGTGGELLYDKKTKKPIMCDGLSQSSVKKIKSLLSLLYDYALMNNIVDKNYAKFIKISISASDNKKTAFTDMHIDVMKNNIDKIPYMEYIYAMCYTGHRINEFLSLTRFDYFEKEGIQCLRGGNKTQAGKNKIVPVHPQITHIIENCLNIKGETIFCNKETGKKFSDKYFREKIYYPALEASGLPLFSPHSCRRTLSTRLSAAGVNENDLIKIMGHTDIKVDRDSYIIQEVKTLKKAINKIS